MGDYFKRGRGPAGGERETKEMILSYSYRA
jgi:hypothetical protein